MAFLPGVGHVAQQGHHEHGKKHEAEKPHAGDLTFLTLLPGQFQRCGKRQHESHARNGENLAPAVQLGAGVIARRQLRPPGKVRNGKHGVGGVEHEQPEGEVERARGCFDIGKKDLPHRKA